MRHYTSSHSGLVSVQTVRGVVNGREALRLRMLRLTVLKVLALHLPPARSESRHEAIFTRTHAGWERGP